MRRLILGTVAVACLCQSLFALGTLYAHRAFTTEASKPLWLRTYDATVTIQDQIAVTHVDQTFKNETNQRLEGIFVFPLPKDAIVTELALWINGQRVIADVMEKDTARAIYESTVRRMVDPALLEYMGDNVFKLSVFPIEPNGNAMSERRIEITYAELLPYESGSVDYRFFMKTVNLSPKPVERASLSVTLTAQKDIVDLTCPTYSTSQGLSIQRRDSRSFAVVFGNENATFTNDVILRYTLSETDLVLNHLTYAPSQTQPMFFDVAGDNPYFLLWVTPPTQVTQQKVISKNVVLVADVSSSMAGTRITQVRSALNAMIDMFNPADQFNIVSFGTAVNTFRTNLVAVTGETKSQAHTYINALVEFGLTNMEQALSTAFRSTWSDTSVNVVVFLTDGRPTWPVSTSRQAILDTVKAHNAGQVASLFTFGIGTDVDDTLLSLLAAQNSGLDYSITTDEGISALLTGFMQRISYPLIKNCALSLNGLDAYDMYPRQLPNLYAGTQLTVLGRYRTPGTYTVGFGGTQGSQEIVLQGSLKFPASQNQAFVPRMWASAKIDALLDEIKVAGEQPELVTAVKQLSTKYNIITPYTSMLVLEPGNPTNLAEDKTTSMPATLALFQNAPNPFTSSTTIRFSIPRGQSPQAIALEIFDARGRLVRSLVKEMSMGGNFVATWDARDSNGRTLAAGTYLAVLKVGSSMRQMMRMRLVR